MLLMGVVAGLGSLISLPTAAHASDALDTRVTFTIADDNLARGPQDTVSGSPSVPNAIPTAANTLFFDNYDTRNSGFENLSHLVLYGRKEGFFKRLDTEAALILGARIQGADGVRLVDDGSYLRFEYQINDTNSFSLTAFPVTADRFRLGYSYDVSWAGSRIFRNSRAAPGLKMTWQHDRGYVFLGAKTGLGQVTKSDATTQLDTLWGVLAGAGYDIIEPVRLELGAGFFHRGTIDKPDLRISDGNGRYKVANWRAFGGSAQLSYKHGLEIGTSVDFRLYRNSPFERQVFIAPETYNDGLSYAIQTEFSVLGQSLQDPDQTFTTTTQLAMAGDISGRVKWGPWRFHSMVVYRSLSFLLFDVPSDPSFMDFPDGVSPNPEIFLATGFDYFIKDWHLTPGFIVGLQRPAFVESTSGIISASGSGGGGDGGDGSGAAAGTGAGAGTGTSTGTLTKQTTVFRSESSRETLNPGESVGLVVAAKATLKWELSSILTTAFELQYAHDPNRRRLAADASGIGTTGIKDNPHVVGFNLLLQARF